MGKATFRMVAAGDGSPQSPAGYRYYLVAHAVATALLLIALVAAIWQFMDWVGAPSCLSAGPAQSVTLTAHTEGALDRGDCPCPHSGGAKSP
jgi:hypothetical protein